MDCKEFARRRQKVAETMEDGELLVLFSGSGIRKSADETYPFFANRNFLYMTGIGQENSTFIMRKTNGELCETLYMDLPDESREIWTGRRLREQEVIATSDIGRVADINAFKQELHALLCGSSHRGIWLCLDRLQPDQTADLEHGFCKSLRACYPHITVKNCYSQICEMRKFKSDAEIEAIRHGMEITRRGIIRMMQKTKPGMMEYQLEAEFDYELKQHGQRSTAFASIIAYGERNFYLHYPSPMSEIGDDGLVLTDVGAPYDSYCTDISRMFPANGHFSQRQKQLYLIALEANKEIMRQIRPGKPFEQNNQICREVVFEGLKKLGLLSDFADISRYVWHGVTHHVGLDTHDVGGYQGNMQERMILTVDAGIYVREWGIGLRIEDNVLVTSDGCENLSKNIPVTVEEIEAVMGGSPV